MRVCVRVFMRVCVYGHEEGAPKPGEGRTGGQDEVWRGIQGSGAIRSAHQKRSFGDQHDLVLVLCICTWNTQWVKLLIANLPRNR
eukprot:1562421-Pleurochrysis_carterae.AAC.1